jgi:hypothetical protein
MVKPRDSTHEGAAMPLEDAIRKAGAAAAQADDKRRTAETYAANRLPRDVANVTRLLRDGARGFESAGVKPTRQRYPR